MTPTHPTPELAALPERSEFDGNTGIYVRATCDGKWGSHDIAELSGDSLLAWLRADGGCNALAENTLLTLFNHEQVARQARTATVPQGVSVPDGWVLVPIDAISAAATELTFQGCEEEAADLLNAATSVSNFGQAVQLTKCCGREECGGECGNEWRGTEWVRKATPPPAELGEGNDDGR